MFDEEPVVVHVKRVPATFEVRVIFVATLLHCCLLAGVFDRSGVGCTVTIKSVVVPSQPLARGVM